MAQPLSAEAVAELDRSPETLARVHVYDSDGRVVLASDADADDEDRITVGRCDVSENRDRSVPGDATVTLVGSSRGEGVDRLVPLTATDLLSPLSRARAEIAAGVRLPDGSVEWIPACSYAIETTEVVETTNGLTVSLGLTDWHRHLDDSRFAAPYVIPAGTNVAAAVRAILRHAIPSATLEGTTGYVTPRLEFDAQTSRLEAITKLADSIGTDPVFDRTGVVLRLVADPTTDDPPTWTLYRGADPPAGAVRILGGSVRYTDRVYNGVILEGRNLARDAAQARGEAWDTNPTSATYYDPAHPDRSTFGARPFFAHSEYVATDAQAAAAARARLPKVRRMAVQSTLTVRANPAIEVRDVVAVDYARIGLQTATAMVKARRFDPGTPGAMVLELEDRAL